jgi:hypothetical protein
MNFFIYKIVNRRKKRERENRSVSSLTRLTCRRVFFYTQLVFDCEGRLIFLTAVLFSLIGEFHIDGLGGDRCSVSFSSISNSSSVSSNIGAGRRPITNVKSSGDEDNNGTT